MNYLIVSFLCLASTVACAMKPENFYQDDFGQWQLQGIEQSSPYWYDPIPTLNEPLDKTRYMNSYFTQMQKSDSSIDDLFLKQCDIYVSTTQSIQPQPKQLMAKAIARFNLAAILNSDKIINASFGIINSAIASNDGALVNCIVDNDLKHGLKCGLKRYQDVLWRHHIIIDGGQERLEIIKQLISKNILDVKFFLKRFAENKNYWDYCFDSYLSCFGQDGIKKITPDDIKSAIAEFKDEPRRIPLGPNAYEFFEIVEHFFLEKYK